MHHKRETNIALFELLNGLISLKHHDVITVVENRPQLSHQKVAKTHHIIFGAKKSNETNSYFA